MSEQNEEIAIGKAKLDGFQKKTQFKLEDDKDNEFRILPPLGANAAKGIWSAGHAVHWGYKNSDGKMRPFLCVEKVKWVNKQKIVEVACPCCQLYEKADNYYKKKDAELKEKGVSDEKRKEALKTVSDYKRRFNRSFRFYMNAIDRSGTIGRLDISSRHRGLLVAKLKEFEAKGVDCLAPNEGHYFNFKYQGKDGHSVSVVMEDLGNGTMAFKKAPLTPAIISRLKSETVDVTDLFTKISMEQVKQLADNQKSPELPKLVDSIFKSDRKESASTSAIDDYDPYAEDSDAPPASAGAAPEAPAEVSAPPPAASKPTASIPQAAPAKALDDIKNISAEDFNSIFNT